MNSIQQDKFMLKLLLAHWFIATFITSYPYATYFLGFTVGGVISLIVYLAYKYYNDTPFFRNLIAIALMSYSALFIQQFYGRIEMHFHVFIGLAFLTIYRDRLPIAIGSIFIIIHHIVFNYLQQFNVAIFNTKIVIFNYGCGLDIALFHAVMVLAEWFVIDLAIKGKIKEFQIIKDTQEQLVKANEQITKEHIKYHSMMENASDSIYIMNTDGKLIECSQKASELLGYTKEEMLQLHVYDWDVSHTKAEALSHIKNTPTTAISFDTQHKRKNGTIYDASITAVKIKLNNEDYIYASVRDITQEKYLQSEILRQKKEFEAIFRYSKDGIALLDLESNFLDFNEAYLNMTGFSEEELLTKSGYELTAPEDKENVMRIMKEVLQKGYVENFEKSCIVSEGRKISTNMSINLLPDKKRLLLVAKDITSLKQLEHQSRLASMGEMIGNIAHQWRQPLSVIATSSTSVLLYKDMDKLTNEIIENSMNLINENAQYLSKTIDDFRDYIKGERLEERFFIKDNIEQFLRIMEGSVKSNHINVIKNIENNITLLSFPNELLQCYINIFTNAKDALADLDGEKFFFITITQENDQVIIKFKDNAGGIEHNVLPHIFEPYYTTKHKSKGTGLGLSMTYTMITEGMHGEIAVQNSNYTFQDKEYKGAEFTIKLPIIDPTKNQ